MGLEINKTFKNNTKAAKCYARILRMEFAPEKGQEDSMNVAVVFYYDKQTKDEDITNIIQLERYIITPIKETREEVYTHLKTLEDFKNAKDI